MVDFTDVFNSIFNRETIISVIWFLGIYYVFYLIIGILFQGYNSSQIVLAKFIDLVILSILMIYLVYTYYNVELETKQDLLSYILNEVKRELKDPMTIVYIGFMLLFFYIFSYTFSISNMYAEQPFTLYLIEQKLWIYIALLLIVDFFVYILKIPIVDFTYALFGNIWDSLTSSSLFKYNAMDVPPPEDYTKTSEDDIAAYDDTEPPQYSAEKPEKKPHEHQGAHDILLYEGPPIVDDTEQQRIEERAREDDIAKQIQQGFTTINDSTSKKYSEQYDKVDSYTSNMKEKQYSSYSIIDKKPKNTKCNKSSKKDTFNPISSVKTGINIQGMNPQIL